jgi:hypothetical protein
MGKNCSSELNCRGRIRQKELIIYDDDNISLVMQNIISILHNIHFILISAVVGFIKSAK